MRIVDTALVAIGLAYAFTTPAPADELEPSQHAIEAHRDIDYMPGAEYPDARDRLDVFMPTQASGSPAHLTHSALLTIAVGLAAL